MDINDGRPRTVSFVNNAQGEVIKRDVAYYNNNYPGEHELHYYLNGQATGDITSNGASNYGITGTQYIIDGRG